MHGKVIECKPTALQKRRENQNTVALDSEQNQIRRRDIVKVLEGPHAGRDGEIKHLYRSLAFLHSRMYTENGGIFVCKTRHLKLAGGNKNTTNTNGEHPRLRSVPSEWSAIILGLKLFVFSSDSRSSNRHVWLHVAPHSVADASGRRRTRRQSRRNAWPWRRRRWPRWNFS